jgi:hypothetical protein
MRYLLPILLCLAFPAVAVGHHQDVQQNQRLAALEQRVTAVEQEVSQLAQRLSTVEDNTGLLGDALTELEARVDALEGTEPPPPPAPRCDNGLDDDGDGKVDLADPGCTDAQDDSESPDPEPPPTGQLPAESAPDCSGYSQPRAYLEGQSWWEPQNGPASHPGTGKQGHIHIEGCVPIYQHFTGTETLGFDWTARVHNMPGELRYLVQKLYGEPNGTSLYKFGTDGVRCPTADCVFQIHTDVDLSVAQYSGLQALTIGAQVLNEPGADGERHAQMTSPYFPLYIDDNGGQPPVAGELDQARVMLNNRGLLGDTYYPSIPESYAQVGLARADLPYVESSLAPKPVSGTWTPRVFFEKDTAFAYVDPKLHASPVDLGLVVLDENISNNSFRDLSIDTTRLENGWHRLLVGTCNLDVAAGSPPDVGDHCGALVVRFQVAN